MPVAPFATAMPQIDRARDYAPTRASGHARRLRTQASGATERARARGAPDEQAEQALAPLEVTPRAALISQIDAIKRPTMSADDTATSACRVRRATASAPYTRRALVGAATQPPAPSWAPTSSAGRGRSGANAEHLIGIQAEHCSSQMNALRETFPHCKSMIRRCSSKGPDVLRFWLTYHCIPITPTMGPDRLLQKACRAAVPEVDRAARGVRRVSPAGEAAGFRAEMGPPGRGS